MNGLRTILNNFGECLIKRNYIDPDAERNKTEAEIKALFLELIGEDQALKWHIGDAKYGDTPYDAASADYGRYDLQQELRKKVEEL